MIRDIQEIQSLATKYSKQQLAQMAQMGMLDPTKAVMAGMMIKRIEEQNQKPPQSTVAQDVLGAPQQMPMQQPQPQQQQPQQPQQPQQMAQAPTGMESLPAGDVGNYAGGGIVAFSGEDESLVRQDKEDRESFMSGIRRLGAAGMDVLSMPVRGIAGAGETVITRPLRAMGVPLPYLPESFYGGDRSSATPYMDRIRKEEDSAAPDQSSAETARLQRQNNSNPFNTPNNRNALPPVRSERAAGPRASTNKSIESPTDKGFDQDAIKIKGAKLDMPTVSDLKTIKETREQQEAAEGFNKNLTKDQIKRIEDKQKKLEGYESSAGGEALMNFGLGLLGAKRGQEFATAGKSAQAALSAYKSDVKDLRSAKEKLDERAETLRVAENQAKKTNSATDIAKLDSQQARYDAAKSEVFKADNELAKTSALVSANVYGTNKQIESAREGHQVQLQVAQLAHSASMYNANVIKQGNLDNARSKMLIDASDSFIKNYAGTTAYMQNPQLLQQDAMDYARRLAERFGVSVPGNQPATAAAPAGNRPPLGQFRS
jgi:hypothetical protein